MALVQAVQQHKETLSPVLTDIIAERQRQQTIESWTPGHDEAHGNGELGKAALSYLQLAALWCNPELTFYVGVMPPSEWLWANEWWKLTNPRRDLVKAAALIAAEIERIDRAAMLAEAP
jgi:hypothetical protein